MHPILFEIPGWGIRVHAYGVMMFLACTGALWITVWRVKREGGNAAAVYELAAWLFIGGVIGARALFVLQHPETIHSAFDLFRSWDGGNVFYGCIIGGLTGSLIYWWRHPFPFWPMADAVAPALAVGVMFGRIGCYLNGCCYGVVSELPWAMRFPAGSHAWMGQIEEGVLPPAAASSLPVHPTQLYAAAAGLVILGILTMRFPYRRRHGEIMVWLMVLYALSRWPVEMLRNDDTALIAGMTISQVISLILLAAAAWFWPRLPRRNAIQTAFPSQAKDIRPPLALNGPHMTVPDACAGQRS